MDPWALSDSRLQTLLVGVSWLRVWALDSDRARLESALLLVSYVTLRQLLKLSEDQLPSLENGI